jgi:hypothetical protein
MEKRGDLVRGFGQEASVRASCALPRSPVKRREQKAPDISRRWEKACGRVVHTLSTLPGSPPKVRH